MNTKPRLEDDLVEEFVRQAHLDLGRVEAMLSSEPALLNSTWDWGGGDWETGLGGASHMGKRDIALYLLDAGARLDIFAAAMLGYIDVVRTAVEAQPTITKVAGPHGIPLIAHAEAGGEQASEVLEFLQQRLQRDDVAR
jgi:hypothetical protein